MTRIGERLGRWTYLAFELVWSIPVLLLHWAIGAPDLKSRWRVLVASVALPTIYLSAADRYAIKNGIWEINPDRTTGWKIAGLPIEEALFFFITNLMVVQSILLIRGPVTRQRIRRLHRMITR